MRHRRNMSQTPHIDRICVVNVLDSLRLDGKVAVVTGGAGLFGRRFGAALARPRRTAWLGLWTLRPLRRRWRNRQRHYSVQPGVERLSRCWMILGNEAGTLTSW